MRILFVHGRAQGGKDKAQLKSEWIATLQRGFKANGDTFPDNLVFDFPYYGDKLDQFTAQAKLPASHDVVAKGTGQDRQFEQFMQSVLQEMKENTGLSDQDIEPFFDGEAATEKGVQNWRWVQAIVRAIDTHFTEAAEFTIEKFLSDVFLYVNKPAIGSGINKIVQDELTTEPTIVVGHSLGSVVAYNVLNNSINNIDLVKFITVGSPLGIRAIAAKLGVLNNPAAKHNWYNAYDKRDIVALNPLDHSYFPTTPPIDNNAAIKNHTDNRHGIVGYLNDTNVAAEIAKCLT